MAELPVTARRLKQARLWAGLSQRKLGLAVGLDESASNVRINQYERGRHTPNFSMTRRLAKVLGVPAPFLYAEDDGLANWILAYEKVGASTRATVLKKAE